MMHVNNTVPDFEELEHTADIAIRVRGHSLASLFENASRGMVALISGGTFEDAPAERRSIRVEADRTDALLREWLSEIIFLISVERALPVRYAFEGIDERSAAAILDIVPMTEEVARNATEIKAVTWHGLRVERTPGGFMAEVVFDT